MKVVMIMPSLYYKNRVKSQRKKIAKLPRSLIIQYNYLHVYLGIELDSSLNLNSHYKNSMKKASGRLNLLSKLRNQMDSKTAESIYKVMVLPMFNYCSLLMLKQNNIIKNNETEDIKSLPSIDGFKKQRAGIFVQSCLNGNQCENFVNMFSVISHDISTRDNTHLLRLPKIRTEYGRRAVLCMAALIYNDLPLKIRTEDLYSKFCKMVKLHYS